MRPLIVNRQDHPVSYCASVAMTTAFLALVTWLEFGVRA
jgi:hypothetical protein